MPALNDKTRVGMCVDDWPAGTVSSTNGDSLSLLQEASSLPLLLPFPSPCPLSGRCGSVLVVAEGG